MTASQGGPASAFGRDYRPKGKARRVMHYREAWGFKGDTEELIRDQLATCPRPVVHLCAGASRLGDVRVDIIHPGADLRADARRLPFRNGSVGTVLMDPPWPAEAWSFGDRMNAVAEVGRVLQVGGVFLLYAPWWPALLWADMEQAWVRVNGSHALPFAPVILSRWRRTRADYGAREAEAARRGRAAA